MEYKEVKNQAEEEKEQAKLTPKPWVPQIITGGKGPPEVTDNWLMDTPELTTFLVQARSGSGFMLGEFVLAKKMTRSCLVFNADNQKPGWLDPVRFCRDYRLWEVLQTREEALLEKKANALVLNTQQQEEQDD